MKKTTFGAIVRSIGIIVLLMWANLFITFAVCFIIQGGSGQAVTWDIFPYIYLITLIGFFTYLWFK